MKQISELESILIGHFNWNKARINCLANLLLGIITVRTINLVEIALAFRREALPESSYKRLQRFFRNFSFDVNLVSLFIINLFKIKEGSWHLTLDRTNWEIGKISINILVLGVAYYNISIPLFWLFLDKRGQSNYQEQMSLIKKFIKFVGKEHIAGILADREFASKQLFNNLTKLSIPFYIRIKSYTNITNARGIRLKASWLFRDLKPGFEYSLSYKAKLFGSEYFIRAARLFDGDLLIVASNFYSEGIYEAYRCRWEIETLFGCLKSKGFRFESTKITHPERLSKILCILSLSFSLAYYYGIWVHQNIKKISLKKHGRKQKSLFRHGLDRLRHMIINDKRKNNQFKEFIMVLKFSLYPHDLGGKNVLY